MQTANEFFEPYAEGPVAEIGRGMEGVVYDLGGELVGKTWFNRSAADIRPLEAFLAELSKQQLPFRTPEIREVGEVDGRAVSVEVKLAGVPLPSAVEAGSVSQEAALDLFVSVVEALGSTSADEASKALPVVEEQTPFYGRPCPPDGTRFGGRPGAPDETLWGDALADLVLRRAAASRRLLSADVAGFDELVEQVVDRLREISVAQPSIVHGDICQPNLLVDEDGQLALLDWGFLTTAGDNTFDAATAAGFFDMYGPDAEGIDNELLDRFEELGHSRQKMNLYRVAYALITATIYHPEDRDGHYHWCLRNLTRLQLR